MQCQNHKKYEKKKDYYGNSPNFSYKLISYNSIVQVSYNCTNHVQIITSSSPETVLCWYLGVLDMYHSICKKEEEKKIYCTWISFIADALSSDSVTGNATVFLLGVSMKGTLTCDF